MTRFEEMLAQRNRLRDRIAILSSVVTMMDDYLPSDNAEPEKRFWVSIDEGTVSPYSVMSYVDDLRGEIESLQAELDALGGHDVD